MPRRLGYIDVLAAAVDASYGGERRRMVADHGYPLRHFEVSLHPSLAKRFSTAGTIRARTARRPEASDQRASPMPRRTHGARAMLRVQSTSTVCSLTAASAWSASRGRDSGRQA